MGLKLIPYRHKKGFRPNWYARVRGNGKDTTENLGVLVRGIPPKSGRLTDRGDEAFERSREKAQAKLDDLLAQRRERGQVYRETTKIIEIKTGRKFCDPPLDTLASVNRERFLARDQNGKQIRNPDGTPRYIRSTSYLSFMDKAFANLATFAAAPKAEGVKRARSLLEITPELAQAFLRHISATYSWETTQKYSHLLSGAYARLTPCGTENPFLGALASVTACGSRDERSPKEVIHRRPLDRTEIRKLYRAARSDSMLYNIAVTACSTGMRIGDVCKLKWQNIDLNSNYIEVIAGKTGNLCTIPIFDYDPKHEGYDRELGEFRRILEAALAERHDGEVYVFPDAAKAYDESNNRIYHAGKALFARALFGADAAIEDISEFPSTPESVEGAIENAPWNSERKQRVLDTYRRHTAGDSYARIHTDTGRSKSQISYDLSSVERLTGTRIRPNAVNATLRDLIDKTRSKRKNGMRQGSTYGWHSCRAGFVVLMMDNGVPVDTVKDIVGHTTEKMTREYYHPTRKMATEKVRKILGNAMRRSIERTPLPSRTTTAIEDQSSPSTQHNSLARLVKALSPQALSTIGRLSEDEKAELRTMNVEQAEAYLAMMR